MRLSPLNSISFKSIPLHDVKLRKALSDGTYEEIDAQFSRLETDNEEDILAVEDIRKNWKDARFGAQFALDFLMYDARGLADYNFYAIERNDANNKREIYSIAEFDGADTFIELLQANPNNKNEGIKGAGEVMLYGIAKESKPSDSDYLFYLEPTSYATEFYRKSGLKASSIFFILPTEKKDKFLNRIEEKYNFNIQA